MTLGLDPEKALEAASNIVDKIPIYQDALQPSVREVGKGLETVTKTVLLPIRALKAVVWGVDQIEAYLNKTLEDKLKNVPKENLQAPPISVAGPIVEAMRFHSDSPDLQDMFANLLANAMDSRTANIGHPGYVEIIKQLTSDEAHLLRYLSEFVSKRTALPIIDVKRESLVPPGGETVILRLISTFGIKAGCKYPHNTPKYLDNLSRLGLVYIPEDLAYTNTQVYSEVTDLPEVAAKIKSLTVENLSKGIITHRTMEFTSFGEGFLQACVVPKA